jgi:hypothetical protein
VLYFGLVAEISVNIFVVLTDEVLRKYKWGIIAMITNKIKIKE